MSRFEASMLSTNNILRLQIGAGDENVLDENDRFPRHKRLKNQLLNQFPSIKFSVVALIWTTSMSPEPWFFEEEEDVEDYAEDYAQFIQYRNQVW